MAQITPPPSSQPDAADVRVRTPGVPPELSAAATAVVLRALAERPAALPDPRRRSAWQRSARGLRSAEFARNGWGGFTG